MRFFTLLALAGAAIATPEVEKRQDSSVNTASIYGVLITALPSSLLAEATNTAKLSSDIANQFKTTTPGWFQSLPSDVQSYLIDQGESTMSVMSTAGTAGASSGVSASKNASTIATPTLSASSGSGSSSGGSSGGSGSSGASSVSTAAAAIPTAVVGGGIAGLIGLIGMLAL
ncbi:hypothetical protein NA57DRAFT_60533 [Rhizodiscina lignyota]|uniref:Uncharacterized protein n=1 Tax=Rhizodiscina lignyota TaxID=1504668 RepID=A0A9P4I7C5_9PEZI|nr:hypothetical protein NA57DRAFT_60533 [Rhizodiscina lignyota]